MSTRDYDDGEDDDDVDVDASSKHIELASSSIVDKNVVLMPFDSFY